MVFSVKRAQLILVSNAYVGERRKRGVLGTHTHTRPQPPQSKSTEQAVRGPLAHGYGTYLCPSLRDQPTHPLFSLQFLPPNVPFSPPTCLLPLRLLVVGTFPSQKTSRRHSTPSRFRLELKCTPAGPRLRVLLRVWTDTRLWPGIGGEGGDTWVKTRGPKHPGNMGTKTTTFELKRSRGKTHGRPFCTALRKRCKMG